MPKSSLAMVEDFRSFVHFVENLRIIGAEHWNKPISEGKWTLKDIIAHILLWDKYFYDEGIKKINSGESVTVKHLNFDDFNANAVEYAKKFTKEELIEQCIEYRTQIIDAISGLTEEDYMKEYKDGDKKKFTIRAYLRGFIPHDNHHKKQIEKYIKTRQIM